MLGLAMMEVHDEVRWYPIMLQSSHSTIYWAGPEDGIPGSVLQWTPRGGDQQRGGVWFHWFDCNECPWGCQQLLWQINSWSTQADTGRPKTSGRGRKHTGLCVWVEIRSYHVLHPSLRLILSNYLAEWWVDILSKPILGIAWSAQLTFSDSPLMCATGSTVKNSPGPAAVEHAEWHLLLYKTKVQLDPYVADCQVTTVFQITL